AAIFDYVAATDGDKLLDDGLCLGFGLKAIESYLGKTVTLDSTASVAVGGPLLNAQLTGAGSFVFSGSQAAKAGNAGSDYSGATTVDGLELTAIANNVFGNTSSLSLVNDASVDFQGNSQTVGALNGESGTSLALGSGSVLSVGGTVHDGSGTFAGVISGAGSLTKLGAGILTLTGDNIYEGGTTIFAGALQLGGGGETGSVTGDIVDNAALIFNRSDDLAYEGVISGSGSMTKLGAGTLTLSGTNTYEGGTTISAGTLQLGGGGETGSVIGNIVDNAALIFNRSDDIAYEGVISGSGSMTKLGAGILTLSGTNTYEGGTTISAGTLQIGSGGTVGSVAGNIAIAENAALIFNRSDEIAYDGEISGAGSLTKVGAETLTLTGDSSSFGGDVTVANGALDLSGKLTAQNITIESGAFFNITGTELNVIGQLNILSGGTLDIVNHPERLLNLGATSELNNNGLIVLNHEANFNFGLGSNILKAGTLSGTGDIQMYVNIANNIGDMLVFTGIATDTRELLLTNLGADPTGSEPALLLAQTGGGSTSTFTGGLCIAGTSLCYQVQDGSQVDGNTNNWYLVLSDLYTPIIGRDPPPPPAPPGIVNYIGAQRINTETGFLQLANLSQRVGEHRSLPTTERQSWARTYRSQGSEDGKRGFGYDQDTTGVQVGQEVLVKSTGNGGTLRAALAFDYARTDADFDDRTGTKRDTGSMKAESYALGGYLTHTTANGAYLDLVVQTAKLHNDFTIKDGEARDKATQKGWRAGLSVEGGCPLWKIDNAWLLEGQAQLSYQYTKYQSFKDNKSKVDAYDADTLRGRLGARLVRELTTAENKPLKLYGLVNVYRDFLKPESVTFVNKSNGVSTNVSERYGKSWGEVGLGVQGWVNKSTSVFGDVSYQRGFSSPDKGSAREGGAVNIGVRFNF
ncbi:MAG: autotransporter outer membrane beta-barrel domain-containing protein, partial [Candidatus Accumulibacter sp.]|nr:autotransporter outer membrane beta-barrel domain-containing protein [Accumulibacter sp.]